MTILHLVVTLPWSSFVTLIAEKTMQFLQVMLPVAGASRNHGVDTLIPIVFSLTNVTDVSRDLVR